MTINSTKWSMIRTAVSRISKELDVDIYEFEVYGQDKPYEWGVNWSAKGTCTVEETLEYATKLTVACEYVKYLNALKIKVDWLAEKTDINDQNREYFINQMEILYNRMNAMKDIVWNF
jgi:hypothetical protein